MYWQYFNQNRWQFYNRTKTAEKVDSEDFRTWDLQTLFDETHEYYQKSLENGLMLQLEPLGKYDDIIIVDNDSKQLRTTLYDFLLTLPVNLGNLQSPDRYNTSSNQLR